MFGAETWALAARGDWPTATVYVVATLVLSVGAVAVTASGDDRVS